MLLFLAVCLLPLAVATSCEREDDVDAIFDGGTWKVTGVTVGGKALNGEDLKELYLTEGTYVVRFVAGAFSGTLGAGSSMDGTWWANGRNGGFGMVVEHATGVDVNKVSASVFGILEGATRYDGDMNVLRIKKDERNYVQLTKMNAGS